MQIEFLEQQLDILNELTQLLTTFNSEGYSTNRKILEIELQEKTLDQQREEALLARTQHVQTFNGLRSMPITDSLSSIQILNWNVHIFTLHGFDTFSIQSRMGLFNGSEWDFLNGRSFQSITPAK